MTQDWVASHNEICALLRQAHDALALTSYPPKREWQGLTDDEVMVLNRQSYEAQIGLLPLTFYRAIEAKLKEKNA